MPLLNPRDQDYLRGRFAEELENPVKLVHFTQNAAVSQLIIPGRENCLYCRETRELMEEVAGLTDKIELEVYEFRPDAPEAAALGISRVPATAGPAPAGTQPTPTPRPPVSTTPSRKIGGTSDPRAGGIAAIIGGIGALALIFASGRRREV